jgi:hypothetical protein
MLTPTLCFYRSPGGDFVSPLAIRNNHFGCGSRLGCVGQRLEPSQVSIDGALAGRFDPWIRPGRPAVGAHKVSSIAGFSEIARKRIAGKFVLLSLLT